MTFQIGGQCPESEGQWKWNTSGPKEWFPCCGGRNKGSLHKFHDEGVVGPTSTQIPNNWTIWGKRHLDMTFASL